ncbi:L-serine dehydratase [Algimonas ampicilliniresistens]|uniref:L-serine dehydratase n=1 Tax=Algimonas ampicilliniresistens TaxID=1298735 RepID=A0ABQ5V654_9PROT|nr:L-serine ammonia-lyase [Algimonas ampicilliniresistens]GLQ22328.1 L-serine dehydratase [Algimonas ampicilliniresistens]
MLSVLDIFRIGVGPSSSHTVGPMRIAARYRKRLTKKALSPDQIEIVFRGSLAFTGDGHGTFRAAKLGLLGFVPETIEMAKAETALAQLNETGRLPNGSEVIVTVDYDTPTRLHPNEMVMIARCDGETLDSRTYYSTGGGFIASHAQLSRPVRDDLVRVGDASPHPFGSAEELLDICAREALPIAQIILANEDAKRPRAKTLARIDQVAAVMMQSVDRGLAASGLLPGSLKVQRRASKLWQKLTSAPPNEREALFDWLNVYAMAVNEENAAGGQVVTAPTNGAAGIIPSIIRHYCHDEDGSLQVEQTRRFLLTAGGIGLLYKQRASISGAEMGCQGEVGVACSMAAGGLCAVWGGSPEQVASAAEIGMEHNLGLTCDPVGGLVQIPCIERNAIGAVKAANAARLALHAPGQMIVSLDAVIETMRQTGLDMSSKYKETSQGGLAVNVIEC